MTQSLVLSPQPLPSLLDDEARHRVVTELGTTFLVEAGAGTGKTSVLLQRLLALVRSGCSQLERIAAITFTEKAATELRIRLREEIEIALLGPLSDEGRRSLHEARSQLERAQISTVHAFCAALLRERPIEARVDPDFTVLNGFGAHLLQAETWREWLAHEMDQSPDILKQALRAGVTLSHLEALRNFVVEHRDCLSLLPAPVEASTSRFRTTFQCAVVELSALKTSCVNEADRAFAQINTLSALFPPEEKDASWERLFLRDLPLSLKAGTKTNWKPGVALDKVRALFSQIAEAYTQARAARSHNLSVGLARWLDGYLRAYQDNKRERSSLDFVDLLLTTRDLLKHNLEVRRYFQRRFHYLLVDEFQDTDPLQAEIIFFLAEREPRSSEWAAVTLQPGKLFLVGDPQQSIYRFRRADLEVYVQARAVIANQGEVLPLATNFRTRAPALEWINETFIREFGSVEAGQPAYRPLIAARQEGTEREVILLPISDVPANAGREELRRAEARTVAAFIAQTVAQGDTVVWGDRPLGYRDIAVLFRTYQAMETYEEAFQDAGVPYRILGGRRYATRQEVEELRALLRAIESPSDTVALVATLRSSLFGFSDEELAVFVSAGGKLDYTKSLPPKTTPGADRFAAAFTLLCDFHSRRAQMSPAALLYEIYTQTHLLLFFALRPQGLQRVANLLKLLDTARALSSQGFFTLSAFNRFLEQQEDIAQEPESPTIEEHDPALRLLTIHKAKGLEFPVVILADAVYSQRRLPRTGIIDRVRGSLELHIGRSGALTCSTQGWQKAETWEQEREATEERRLWYVAATRVRDHLVIPALFSQETGSSSSWQRVFAGDNLSNAFLEKNVRSKGVFVYQRPVHTREQTLPRVAADSVIAAITPDQAALRLHQEWETQRSSTLAHGRKTGSINAVTALAEAQMLGAVLPEKDESKDTAARRTDFLLGRAVHEALKGGGDNAIASAVGRLWKANEREEAKRLVENAFASSALTRAQAASEHFSELPFVLHHEEHLSEGVIELAFVENAAWVIVDFKTDAVAEAEVAARAGAYKPQLALYALALERLTDRPVKELVLLFVRSRQEVNFSWNADERASAEKMLTERVHSSHNTEGLPKARE